MGFFKGVARFVGVSFFIFTVFLALVITAVICWIIYMALSQKTSLNEASKISIVVFSGILIFLIVYAPASLGVGFSLVDL